MRSVKKKITTTLEHNENNNNNLPSCNLESDRCVGFYFYFFNFGIFSTDPFLRTALHVRPSHEKSSNGGVA